jgi:23S rRNA pseudouridine2605 synthase
MSERLQKLLARHGLGSRRQIEDWIAAGRVLLNGSPAQLGDRFTPGDRLVVDGRDLTGKLAVESTGRVIAYHKMVGEVVATSEGDDATSLLDKLPAVRGSRWLAINPMNVSDTGLLLLSNDGRLVNALKRRSPAIPASYMVRVHVPGREEGEVPEIAPRVMHDDREIEFAAVVLTGGEGANLWYRVDSAHADRRIAVRSLFEAQGFKVSRLIQVSYGNIELPEDLPRGRHRELTNDQVGTLYTLVGLADVTPTPVSRKASRSKPPPDRRGGPRGRKG